MSNSEAIVNFWYLLNDFQEKIVKEDSIKEAYTSQVNGVLFNYYAFQWAEALGIDERQMNRVISAWACTLEKEPPTYLLK